MTDSVRGARSARAGSEKSLVLFGAALDSGNLGVGALASSLAEGVDRYGNGAALTIFDNGLGRRQGQIPGRSEPISYQAIGVRLSRRVYRTESLHNMKLAAKLRLGWNPGVEAIKSAEATLDVSGGDSFTDMYGMRRFRAMTMPKRLALDLGSRLILLPQTYGPYYDHDVRREAEDIVRQATVAWARDARSYEHLTDMVADRYDSERHRLGVDMAFGLSPVDPSTLPTAINPGGSDPDELVEWISTPEPVAGINISGLLANGSTRHTHDAISIDYEQAMVGLINRLLEQSDAKVLIVPHVVGGGALSESDDVAVARIMAENRFDPDRVRLLPPAGLNANTAKWWIGQCQWFCGARMHSTIAGLSSGVPTAAVAYSIKTEPVFATVGLSGQVIDSRSAKTEEAIDFLWQCWTDRAEVRNQLLERLPALKAQVQQQMQTIIDTALCSTGVGSV